MRIGFNGNLEDKSEIKAGFIGCGSHAFRNIFPTFQFAPVNLVACCDLDKEKAAKFAEKFGAKSAYDNYSEMLEKENLDAVFIVTGYNAQGRPQYSKIAIDCLNAGCHVWIEKPPAASCAEIERMQDVAEKNNRQVLVGFKKMFFPANEKAKELMQREDFGKTAHVSLQYPQYVPAVEEFNDYLAGNSVKSVISFLDHLCHPVSMMVELMGMPEMMIYQRAFNGSGSVLFTFPDGAVANLALTDGMAINGGTERTMIVGDQGKHIIVDNNINVTYHCNLPLGYGDNPDFYKGPPEEATASWTPEFSLGQLYNKGLFLLGYYGEVNEFANAILEDRPVAKGTLEQARQITRIFEVFGEAVPGEMKEL